MISTSRRKAISFIFSALGLLAGCTGSFSRSTESSQTTTQISTPTATPKPTPTVSPRLSNSFEQKNIVRGRKIIPLKNTSNFGGIGVSINQAIVTRKNTYEYCCGGFSSRGSVDLKPGDYGPGKDYDFDNPKILLVEIVARSNDVVDVPDAHEERSSDLTDGLDLYFGDITLDHRSSAGLYPTFVIGESEDAKKAFYAEWTHEVADSIESNTFQGTVRGWHSFPVPGDFKKRAALLRLNYLDNDTFFKLVGE